MAVHISFAVVTASSVATGTNIMAASAIAISSDSSDKSVGSPGSRVCFWCIMTVIPSISVRCSIFGSSTREVSLDCVTLEDEHHGCSEAFRLHWCAGSIIYLYPQTNQSIIRRILQRDPAFILQVYGPFNREVRDSYSSEASIEEDKEIVSYRDWVERSWVMVNGDDVRDHVVIEHRDVRDDTRGPDGEEFFWFRLAIGLALLVNSRIMPIGLDIMFVRDFFHNMLRFLLLDVGIKTASKDCLKSGCSVDSRKGGVSSGSDGDNGNGGNGNGGNGNDRNENPYENGRCDSPVARECTYQDFMKCQPHNFKGTEGVVGLIGGLEKWKKLFHVQQLAQRIVTSYCPRNEIQKIETELWNLTMKNNDLIAYTQRFQELTMMCTKMAPKEEDRVEKFIRGLPDNIQGNVIAAEPTRLQDAIRIANNLMDQKLKGYAVRNAENKRRLNNNYGNNHPTNDRILEVRMLLKPIWIRYKENGYEGTLPFCNKCKLHHEGQCTTKCRNYKRIRHLARDCRSVVTIPT
ncbi:reverse transcriptase domain-containing protein [Tanacetum coccineum]